METITKFITWLNNTRLMRANTRYGIARGYLLAGGVAYSALFSIFAGIAISWTIFMSVIGGNKEIREIVIDGIDKAIPGVLDTGQGGLITPDALVINTSFSLASIIPIVILIFTATSVIMSLRMSVQAMFGISYVPENVVFSKLRDLFGFMVLALGVLGSSIITAFGGIIGSILFKSQSGFTSRIVQISSFFASVIVGWIVLVVIIRYIAGARPPAKDLWLGTLPGAFITGLLGILGTSAVGSVAEKPLLAGFAAIITILLWVNIAVRVVMYTAAIVANPPAPRYPEHPDELHASDYPNYVTLSAKETLDWPHEPLVGNIIPDPSQNPEKDESNLPAWDSAVGKIKLWRAARIEAKAAKIRREYKAAQKKIAKMKESTKE